jgi:hypothetical protein
MDPEKQYKSNAERQRTYRLKLRKKGLERVEIKLSKESKQLLKKLCRDCDMNQHQFIQRLLDRAAIAERSAPEWLRSEKKLPTGLHASEIPPPAA